MNWKLPFSSIFASARSALFCAVFAACGFACSNPAASSNAPNIQNFHSRNVNCDSMNFSNGSITTEMLRSLTHCLNSKGEIQAFENWLDAVNDSDLTPVAQTLNEVFTKQPKFLYAIRETYEHAKQTGDLQNLETALANMMADPARNAAITPVLSKMSKPIFDSLLDENYKTTYFHLSQMMLSSAYQRMGSEYFENGSLKTFLLAAVRYLNAQDTAGLPELEGMLSKNGIDLSWSEMVSNDERTHLQNLAHFWEWLESDGHYDTLSAGVYKISTEPGVCFAGGRNVPDSLAAILPRVSKMSTAEAIQYFRHDVKNLYIVGKAYCDFSYELSTTLGVVEKATRVQGFDEIFTLVKPLLADPTFIKFLGSTASKNFMHDIAPLSAQHLPQDLFTLVELHEHYPISNDSVKTAVLLENILKPLQANDVDALIQFASPLLNSQEKYAGKFIKSFGNISESFPQISIQMSDSLRASLSYAMPHLIALPQLANVFTLVNHLIHTEKLNAIVDQMLAYLNDLFARGTYAIRHGTGKTPVAVLASEAYLLAKIQDSPPTTPSVCDSLNYEWNFMDYSSSGKQAYLQEIDALQKCLNPNQTFASAKDLILYAISKGNYGYLLKTQQSAINTLFQIDTPMFMNTVNDFLAVGKGDSESIGKILNLSSSGLSVVKPYFLTKSNLRDLVANIAQNSLLYQSISEITDVAPARSRSSSPTVDLVNLSTVDVIALRGQTKRQVPVEQALKLLMDTYCASLDTSDANCEVDEDQVAFYLKSPKLLFQQIAREELESVNSFLTPHEAKSWKHTNDYPQDVATFEYHLNPTLHLLRKAPAGPTGMLNALTRFQTDKISLERYLKDRASKVTLIPYSFTNPNFPARAAREYNDHIRLRLVNDLDRLELISMNGDYKMPIKGNLGMQFLRSIALSWGDVPAANRPKSLDRYVSPDNVSTLKESRDYIMHTMDSYDTDLLQRLGNCNPNHGGWIKWIFKGPCNQFAEAATRIFNLRFLIPLLDDELPTADGGDGGMEFLRDLFYGLYSANEDWQQGKFADGVSVPGNCLSNPLEFDSPQYNCQLDLLTLVSRISRLGLLHQAGIAILNAKDNPVAAITHDIDRFMKDPVLAKAFVDTLSSDAGVQFMSDATNYGFQVPEGTGKNLSLLMQMLSLPTNTNWMNLGFELVNRDPKVLSENQDLIDALISVNSEEVKPRLDAWIKNPNAPTPLLFGKVYEGLTPAVRNDILTLLVELRPQSKTFAQVFKDAKAVPDLHLANLRKDAHLMSAKFAESQFDGTRKSFGAWTRGSNFDQFCDVYSDSVFVSKAYNFLESINQNPDSKTFIEDCRDFLNLH